MADENCEGCPVVNAAAYQTARSMGNQASHDHIVNSANAAHHERSLIMSEVSLQQYMENAHSVSMEEARAAAVVATGDSRISGITGIAAAIAAAGLLSKGAGTPPTANAPGRQ